MKRQRLPLLPPDADTLLAAGLRSTAPSSSQAAWSSWFEARAAEADRRALQGPTSAKGYSAKVRAGVRLAIRHLPANGVKVPVADVLEWIERNSDDDGRVRCFGLERVPDKDIVRAVLKEMEAEASSLSADSGAQG